MKKWKIDLVSIANSDSTTMADDIERWVNNGWTLHSVNITNNSTVLLLFYREETPPPQPAPYPIKFPSGTFARHRKGGDYLIIGRGRLAMTGEFDHMEVVIYQSINDPTKLWVRPTYEFEDGRFTPLPPEGLQV